MTEEERFDLFVQRADQLAGRRLLRGGTLSARLNLRFDRNGPFVMEMNEWDEEDFRSLLVDLRPFLMQKEPILVGKIFNMCERRLTSNEIRTHLRTAREDWRQAQKGAGVTIEIDGRELNPERVVDLMLNAKFFHPGSSEERAELAKLGPVGKLLSDYVFQNFVVDAIGIVLYLAHTIKVARGQGLFSFGEEQ